MGRRRRRRRRIKRRRSRKRRKRKRRRMRRRSRTFIADNLRISILPPYFQLYLRILFFICTAWVFCSNV